MAQSFGKLKPITADTKNPHCVRITMPDGSEIGLSIEQPSEGAAYLVVRSSIEMEIRPISTNTIGIRVTE